jgi:hypothetical protein
MDSCYTAENKEIQIKVIVHNNEIYSWFLYYARKRRN